MLKWAMEERKCGKKENNKELTEKMREGKKWKMKIMFWII